MAFACIAFIYSNSLSETLTWPLMERVGGQSSYLRLKSRGDGEAMGSYNTLRGLIKGSISLIPRRILTAVRLFLTPIDE